MHDWWNNLSVVQRSMSALAKGPKFYDIQRWHLSVNLTLYTFVGWLLQPIPKIWELLRVTWVIYQYCRARISKITGWCDWSRLPLSLANFWTNREPWNDANTKKCILSIMSHFHVWFFLPLSQISTHLETGHFGSSPSARFFASYFGMNLQQG